MMIDWIKNICKPTKETYPTWADVPAWDADMKKVGDDMKKVIPFPEPKLVPPMPQVEPPKHDPVAYRIGKTEEGKVTLSLGDYPQTIVTMNNAGVDQLIRMLEAAKHQDEEEE